MAQLYVIWSEEHGAWWAKAKWGYTRSITQAGRFDQDEAERIVVEGNKVVQPDNAYSPFAINPGRKFNELMIPDPFWPCEGDEL